MAAWVARQIDAPSLLIDIGGTTTDIIPVDPATCVATHSRTDFDRLAAGELVYLGGERTPVCSLVDSLPVGSRSVPVMRELFATTDDCRLVLGLCEEDVNDKQTSDGRPRTMAHAAGRLARMIGRDGDDLTTTEVQRMARATLSAATRRLIEAIARQPATHADRWILSGHTAQTFLPGLQEAYPQAQVHSLSDQLGPATSRVGPALACAHLRASTGRFR
jgi:probable H4MPT-linked C1 transfer pathway protein